MSDDINDMTPEDWVKHLKSLLHKTHLKLSKCVLIEDSDKRNIISGIKTVFEKGTIEEKYHSTVVLAAIQSDQTQFMISREILKNQILANPYLSEDEKEQTENTNLLDEVLALLKAGTVKELYPSIQAKKGGTRKAGFCQIVDPKLLKLLTSDSEKDKRLLDAYIVYRSKKSKPSNDENDFGKADSKRQKVKDSVNKLAKKYDLDEFETIP